MENKLNCEIVRDLLPSYADGLTGEGTNRAVGAHLAECPDCARALRLMREPQAEDAEQPQVDYLKKLRKRSRTRSALIGIFLMLLGMGILFVRYFCVGTKAQPEDVSFRVSVQDDTVTISGSLISSGLGVCRVEFSESAGMVNVAVYTAPISLLSKGSFTESYTAHTQVDAVRCDALFLWAEGMEISPTTARLYAAQNAYIGDMPNNSVIANILDVAGQLGPFTNELQTDSEPYGWTLLLENPISLSNERAARSVMEADSYAMLSVIENLGSVTWRYATTLGAREYTVTAQEASDYAQQDIKLCTSSPAALQALLGPLNIKWSGAAGASRFVLCIEDLCNEEISGLGLHYRLYGEIVGSRAVESAGGDTLERSGEYQFEFLSEDFPDGTFAPDLASFSFDVTVTTADGAEHIVCENLPASAEHSWMLRYALRGDSQSGFTLSPR